MVGDDFLCSLFCCWNDVVIEVIILLLYNNLSLDRSNNCIAVYFMLWLTAALSSSLSRTRKRTSLDLEAVIKILILSQKSQVPYEGGHYFIPSLLEKVKGYRCPSEVWNSRR